MITQPIFHLSRDVKVGISESDCLDLILTLLFGCLRVFPKLFERQLDSEK